MRYFLAPPPTGPVEPGIVPTFSVIIAAYPAASFVAETVRSALERPRPPHEVIVCVTPAPDDETERALEPYAGRITFLSEEQRGRGRAQNKALRAASGDFVVILDADDRYLPARLEAALGESPSTRPDLDILTTDAYVEVEAE